MRKKRKSEFSPFFERKRERGRNNSVTENNCKIKYAAYKYNTIPTNNDIVCNNYQSKQCLILERK